MKAVPRKESVMSTATMPVWDELEVWDRKVWDELEVWDRKVWDELEVWDRAA
jgi:hypothetical protein